ncbi:MAG: hypothetical protein HYZ29_30120 [Myxococcales bacterium]|nr:hypothetical protein [Myxococcales bacterium]
MKFWVGVTTIALALGCSSSSTNPGTGGGGSGGASTGGAAGSGATGGTGGAAGAGACTHGCFNKHSDQLTEFGLSVQSCSTVCCSDCDCGGGTTPLPACLACIKGNTCMKAECATEGCKEIVECLAGCSAI